MSGAKRREHWQGAPSAASGILTESLKTFDQLRENDMKKLALLIGLSGLAMATIAYAEGADNPPPASQVVEQPATLPQMSELPKMKAEGERIAALMEKLAKETDPAERRRIMLEVSCPQ